MDKIAKMREKIKEIYKKYELEPDDVFKHKSNHYIIITRSWIEKIQAKEKIIIEYTVCWCSRDYCIVKAKWTDGKIVVETLSSAVQWWKEPVKTSDWKTRWIATGSTDSRYLAEMAEKRAMSRIVLKLTWLYQEKVFWEDEMEWQEDKPPTTTKNTLAWFTSWKNA